MDIRSQGIAALAASLLTTSAFAQTSFPEVEPNTNKAEANLVTGMVSGDSITGTTTGTIATALSTLATSVDNFRIKTGALSPGIYAHKITLASTPAGHTGTIRGLNQTGTVGVGGTAGVTDTAIQTSVTVPDRRNLWYGFGKQEEIFYRVSGTASTTSPYTATLSTTPVAPTVITQAFESANPITISSQGTTTVDTELMLYDSTFTAIIGGVNDDAFGAPNTQSTLTRTLPAGTYYMAIATFELCSNQVAAADDDYVLGFLTDFPDCVVLSSTATTNNYSFTIAGTNGTLYQPNTLTAGDPYRVTWFQFTTAPGAGPIVQPPPANDNCANAQALPFAAGTTAGVMLAATNDGAASCDPGGLASRDVWYSWTNTAVAPRLLSVSTCSTTGLNDTAVSVYAACGGTELGCNDDNAACTAQPLSSLVSSVSVNPGQTVTIRVSDKGLGGTGLLNSFNVVTTVAAPPPVNDQCTAPITIAGLGNFPVDNLGATTGPQGQGEAICNFFGGTAVRQDVWYTWVASNSGPVTVSTCGLIATGPSQDSKIAIYDGAGCPTAAAIACIDDATCTGFSGLNATVTFPAVCGNTYTFQLGMYQGTAATMAGSFSVTGAGPACSTPFTVFCAGDTVGTTCVACGNNGAANKGCANSSFAGGTQLVSGGNASVGTDTLTLTTSDMTGPGLFFQASGLAGSPISFGDGMLCAAVNIQRLGVVFPTAGSATYPGGLTPNPISVGGAPINAGDTKHYQVWYRDSAVFCTASTFNTSNGVTLVWTP